MTQILFSEAIVANPPIEVVERKGIGHPDTIADSLAEELSRQYSLYTKKHFGAILHHNFDKLGILGGKSRVEFGKGYMIKPIRVIVNGRASDTFGNKKIPLNKLINSAIETKLLKLFPNISIKDIKVYNFISTASSPGHRKGKNSTDSPRNHWFKPRSLSDLKELSFLASNDTSLGCSYYPLSNLENFVLTVESKLSSSDFRKKNKWLGTDIKVMAIRKNKTINLTICIPQIANFVSSLENYKKNLDTIREQITIISKKRDFKSYKVKIYFNTRDKYDISELYLTAIGSSIESGDEGLVGRGNRINGLISPFRPMSMEGISGKNPVYHVGKIYNISSSIISKKIYKNTGEYNEVYLVSQSGRGLTDPWMILVNINNYSKYKNKIEVIINKELKNIPKITKGILLNKYRLF